MTFADVSDVRPRVGRPIATAEEELATAWLGDVLRYIRRGFINRGLNLDDQILLEDPTDVDVAAVQAEAVAARLRDFDPEGLTSVSKTADDVTVTKRREGKKADDYTWLTSNQWEEILPRGRQETKAFSIRRSYDPGRC